MIYFISLEVENYVEVGYLPFDKGLFDREMDLEYLNRIRMIAKHILCNIVIRMSLYKIFDISTCLG
jgi:hypothetical protein